MLKLIRNKDGSFDLDYDDPTVNDADAAAATLIWAELYTDAEAPADRVDDPFDRGGWWADSSAGSGLWHVRHQALTPAARLESLEIFKTKLMARDPALTGVDVQEVIPDDPAGNVSSVFIQVTGFHNGRKFIVRAPL